MIVSLQQVVHTARPIDVRDIQAAASAVVQPNVVAMTSALICRKGCGQPSELRLLERRFAADWPTLGICLGAQLMARALGARVYPGSVKEIGWKPLSLTGEGYASSLRHLHASRTSMLHWHGDTFDLPIGATLLASTDVCPHQAYAWGRGAFAF